MSELLPDLLRELRAVAYMLPSRGLWEESGGSMLPRNVCTISADVMEWMSARIDKLDAEIAELRARESDQSDQWPP